MYIKSEKFSNKKRKFNLKNKYLLVRFYIWCIGRRLKMSFIVCVKVHVKNETQKKFFTNLFIELANGLNFMNIRKRKIKI